MLEVGSSRERVSWQNGVKEMPERAKEGGT